MSYLPCEYAVSKAGSVGIAIPGGEFWLEDDDGRIIPDGDTVGELVYRGNGVTLGYASSWKDLAKGDETHGCSGRATWRHGTRTASTTSSVARSDS